jgi:HK97 family phage major capsid protein
MVLIKAINGDPYVEGHLVQFTDQNNQDLENEHFDKTTDFMRESGFPIKGNPVIYEHGLTDFGSIGIGVFDFVDEDDVGLFVRGKLYERQDYEKMLQALNVRKSLGIAPETISKKAKLAEQAVFTVLENVKHGWSLGAYPPTVKISDSGHVEQCGIVEGSLTVIPADPDGTDVVMYRKSLTQAFDLQEAAEETSESGSAQRSKAIEPNNLPGEKQMDMQMLREAVASLLAMIDQGAMEESVAEKQVDPEELEEEAVKAAEELLEKDEEVVKAMDEDEEKVVKAADEEEKEAGMKSARKRVDAFLAENVEEVLSRAMTNIRARNAAATAAFNKARNPDAPLSKRERAGAYRGGNAPAQIGKAEKPGLAMFIKCAANRDFRDFYGKAQNPYIGDHGGYLIGQELRNEILPPLRENVVAFDAGVQQTNVPQGVGTITLPKMTTAPTAYRPGINTAVANSDASFDTVTAFLRPIAALATIPFQLLAQSPLAVEQRIREEMIRSIALQIDIEILNGTGAVTGTQTGAEIRGVKTVLEGDSSLSSSNIATLATNGRKPTFADASQAETQLATNNIPDTEPKAWIMHARSRGRFRDLTATTGEPLFRENFGNEAFARLIGYPVWVGNQIPVTDTTGTSTDTSEIYYGAWRFLEYVMQDALEVIVDRVTLADQLQARIIAYTYSDILIHYPEAFYLMKGVR